MFWAKFVAWVNLFQVYSNFLSVTLNFFRKNCWAFTKYPEYVYSIFVPFHSLKDWNKPRINTFPPLNHLDLDEMSQNSTVSLLTTAYKYYCIHTCSQSTPWNLIHLHLHICLTANLMISTLLMLFKPRLYCCSKYWKCTFIIKQRRSAIWIDGRIQDISPTGNGTIEHGILSGTITSVSTLFWGKSSF